tara:strand:- start:133 stop:1161 length:1029 start_codon:yes stop_codon:yes gene_type:complete
MGNKKLFGKFNETFIIAEVGVNHNNNLSKAKKLIREAKKAGADAVKFQTFTAENLAIPGTSKVPYQKKNKLDKEDHFQMLKKLELNFDQHYSLFNYCKKININFISTPYDIPSAKFLNKLGVKIFKTASADIVDFDLHNYLSKLKKPVIISTGMANLDEIKRVIRIYKNKKKLALLHCVSNYPCSFKSLNLKAIPLLKKKFNVTVGYSDHSCGSSAACAAIALGSKIFEKHITLNKNLKGPDHKASADINDFKKYVYDLRNAKLSLGKPVKNIQKEEVKMSRISRKSLYYNRNLEAGIILKKNYISSLRPGSGLSPMNLDKVLNRKLKKKVKKFTQISLNQF